VVQLADGLRFIYANEATFDLQPGGITCYLDGMPSKPAEHLLLSSILPAWLEMQGLLAFHASAVADKGRFAAFLGGQGSGKSSLAAGFLQSGLPLLTDDILAVKIEGDRIVGNPGLPEMRLWPESERHFSLGLNGFARLNPGENKGRLRLAESSMDQFCETPLPPGCFYILDRRDPSQGQNRLAIQDLDPKEAAFELMRCSYVPYILLSKIVDISQRLEKIIRLAGSAPVRRLVYPGDYAYLPAVTEALLADLAQLIP
jgi:hypothetical protein